MSDSTHDSSLITLRDYQQCIKHKINAAWDSGGRNVLAVLPTGAGKTVLFCNIIAESNVNACVIVHRQELLGQISRTLARNGIVHDLIAPASVIRHIVRSHILTFSQSFYQPNSTVTVSSVDTLTKRTDDLATWASRIKLWVLDEAHHVLKENKWGKAVDMFPHARGLGVTATPLRADGAGLGASSDGVFDNMIVGPSMRELINNGFLTDYKIYAPKSDIDLSDVNVSKATGDFTSPGLKTAIKRSKIIGDIVAHYKKFAHNKLGITFATDVETATQIADAYNAAGVPACVVTAKTPDLARIEILQKFKSQQILQLVNVDLFGEGFDLPALEVVTMARPTQSYGLYVQQFGRALRLMRNKEHAIIIDHVGNVVRHSHRGLPDCEQSWTLSRTSAKKNAVNDAPTLKVCPGCTAPYAVHLKECPYCGFHVEPSSRKKPQHVHGDLLELDAQALEQLRQNVQKVDMSAEDYRDELIRKHASPVAVAVNVSRHKARQEIQSKLRSHITMWAGWLRQLSHSDSDIYRLFYRDFNIDILSAQALNVKDALALDLKICQSMRDAAANPRTQSDYYAI